VTIPLFIILSQIHYNSQMLLNCHFWWTSSGRDMKICCWRKRKKYISSQKFFYAKSEAKPQIWENSQQTLAKSENE